MSSSENSAGEIFGGLIVWAVIIYACYWAWGFFFPSDEKMVLSLSYEHIMVFKASESLMDSQQYYLKEVKNNVGKITKEVKKVANVDFSKSIGDVIDDNKNVSNVEVKLIQSQAPVKIYELSYKNEETKQTIKIPIILTLYEYPNNILLGDESTTTYRNFLYLYGLTGTDADGAIKLLQTLSIPQHYR